MRRDDMSTYARREGPWGLGTVFASHIEAPRLAFFVTFWCSDHRNVVSIPEGERTIHVCAETEAGALTIAQYHNEARGWDFSP